MKENSIEEDIKDIKKYISFTSKRENFSHDTDWNWNKDLANKIEHILSDYKRALKENEILKKEKEQAWEEWNNLEQGSYETEQKLKQQIKESQRENEELKERIREHTLLISPYYVKENYIPIQKIKDKIEELNQYYKKEIYPSLYQWGDITITEHYDEMIALLQELIKESEK